MEQNCNHNVAEVINISVKRTDDESQVLHPCYISLMALRASSNASHLSGSVSLQSTFNTFNNDPKDLVMVEF